MNTTIGAYKKAYSAIGSFIQKGKRIEGSKIFQWKNLMKYRLTTNASYRQGRFDMIRLDCIFNSLTRYVRRIPFNDFHTQSAPTDSRATLFGIEK